MKKIEAIIKPYKLGEVTSALSSLGVGGLTVTPETRGTGRQKGHVELYHGAEYGSPFIAKVRIETCIDDARAEEIVTAILEKARTGKIGDGKIFITNVVDAVRVGTGEKGNKAV